MDLQKTRYMISKHCCVMSLYMHKLQRHNRNTAAVLLAMCVLWALSGNEFTCHIMVAGLDQNVATRIEHEKSYKKICQHKWQSVTQREA
jgi:hypothetical protein